MTRLIALTGYAGSGKSTVARHLVEAHGFTLVKFASPLKQMLKCLGLGDREIEGDLKEKPHSVLCGKTPRHAMQTLGTEWGRDLIGSHLWVNVAVESVLACFDQGGSVVIDDLRFENEADAVRILGGEIISVVRPGIGSVSRHPSEHQEVWPTHAFHNNGTVEELRAMVTSYVLHMSLT